MQHNGSEEGEREPIEPKVSSFENKPRIGTSYGRQLSTLNLKKEALDTIEKRFKQNINKLSEYLKWDNKVVYKRYITAYQLYLIVNDLEKILQISRTKVGVDLIKVGDLIKLSNEMKEALHYLPASLYNDDFYETIILFKNKVGELKINDFSLADTYKVITDPLNKLKEMLKISEDPKNALQQIFNHLDRYLHIPTKASVLVCRAYIQLIVGSYMKFIDIENKKLMQQEFWNPEENFYDSFFHFASKYKNCLESLSTANVTLLHERDITRLNNLKAQIVKDLRKKVNRDYIDQNEIVLKEQELERKKSIIDTVQIVGVPEKPKEKCMIM